MTADHPAAAPGAPASPSVFDQVLFALSTNRAMVRGDFHDFLREVAEASCRALNVERVSTWLLDGEDAATLRCADLYERTPGRHSADAKLLRSDIPAYFEAMEREERAISVDDALTDPRTRELADPYCVSLGITSMLDAPIRQEGRTIGVLCHEHVGPPRAWTAEEQSFAASLADLVSISKEAYERKQIEGEHEELIGRLKALHELTKTINSSLRLEDTLRFIADSAKTLLGLVGTSIFRIKGEKLVLQIEAGSHRPRRLEFEIGEGAAGETARLGRMLFVQDVLTDPLFVQKSWARERGFGTYLGLPLWNEGVLMGVLSCFAAPGRRFTEEDSYLISALAEGAATALANAEAHSRLETAHEKLRQTQALLIRSEKLSSLGTLAAGLAHEILNPATVIGLYAHRMASENPEGAEARGVGEILLRSVERIARICGDLRRFSRDEKPLSRPFHPTETIGQTLRPLESEFRVRGFLLETDLRDTDSRIRGDEPQIRQVIFNIAKNAMEAMSEGGNRKGGALRISSGKIADGTGPGWWEIRLADTGPGIPREDLPKIFDPFFTTKPEDKGTGLGLSVSLGIVEAHQGRIWAESEIGRGTTFVVRLPLDSSSNGGPPGGGG